MKDYTKPSKTMQRLCHILTCQCYLKWNKCHLKWWLQVSWRHIET